MIENDAIERGPTRSAVTHPHETRLREAASRGPRRAALLVTGWLSVGLAVLGMVLPILPTTCFLLLAGACFAKSSPRASHWLHHNRLFGRYLRDYREARVIPLRVKFASLFVLWTTIGGTVVAVDHTIVRLVVLAVATVITAHVATTASRRLDESRAIACPAVAAPAPPLPPSSTPTHTRRSPTP
jgi:hypothetical protein